MYFWCSCWCTVVVGVVVVVLVGVLADVLADVLVGVVVGVVVGRISTVHALISSTRGVCKRLVRWSSNYRSRDIAQD